MRPLDMVEAFLADSFPLQDFAFSYSSFEHSGLGRYGDPLDPDGDLLAMDVARCVIKPGGVLMLGMPTGPDATVFNAHRIYGRHRLPLLLRGWELLDVLGDVDLDGFPSHSAYTEPIFLLRNPI